MFLIGGSIRFWLSWQQNQTAILIVNNLTPTSSCAIDQVKIQWTGSEYFPRSHSPYLQAVVATALETEILPPNFDEWERESRLYYWFMAQMAIKNGNYEDSLEFLKRARAGSMLDAAGHMTSHTDSVCTLINWSIASEINQDPSPDDWYGQVLIRNEPEAAVEAFERLLSFRPNHLQWRLKLAQAYIAINQIEQAEEVLYPIILNGTLMEKDLAATILQSGHDPSPKSPNVCEESLNGDC